MGAIANLITGGIGPGSEIKYLITGGFDIGEAVTPAATDTPSPFKPAIDALFRNRFMAMDATYTPSGGSAVSVRVIRARVALEGALAGAGSFRISPSAQPFALAFEVRVSDVDTPARGDTVTLDSKVYTVREAELITDGLVWRLTVGAPSDA